MAVPEADTAPMTGRSVAVGDVLPRQYGRCASYWWVVSAILCLAALGAQFYVADPDVYLGRTSMIVSSNDRTPKLRTTRR